MKNYYKENRKIPFPQIDEFMQEIEAVCKKYDIEIGHEDGQGAFELYIGFKNLDWFKAATVVTDEKTPSHWE